MKNLSWKTKLGNRCIAGISLFCLLILFFIPLALAIFDAQFGFKRILKAEYTAWWEYVKGTAEMLKDGE